MKENYQDTFPNVTHSTGIKLKSRILMVHRYANSRDPHFIKSIKEIRSCAWYFFSYCKTLSLKEEGTELYTTSKVYFLSFQ